jgi:hypothetical protein
MAAWGIVTQTKLAHVINVGQLLLCKVKPMLPGKWTKTNLGSEINDLLLFLERENLQ